MEKPGSIKWKVFKEALMHVPEAELQFQYAANKRVNASYHITEIKQAVITSVDCGGTMNRWTEIIIQLWEPDGVTQTKAMKVRKALSIIATVERTFPLEQTGIVKIEFGNTEFDVRQMYPGEIIVEGENLVIDLTPDSVQCKAISRGGSCGTTDVKDECCTPPAAKPKTELKNLAATACCEPGCCS